MNQQALKRLVSYDPETGVFAWETAKGGKAIGSPAGSLSEHGYIRLGLDGRRYMAHRMAWLYMTGCEPDGEIDHIDGDRSNNKWSNLRVATRRQQTHNAVWPNQLGMRGIREYKPGKFQARISFFDARNGKSVQKSLGYYPTAEEANEVYELAARMVHGEFYRGAA